MGRGKLRKSSKVKVGLNSSMVAEEVDHAWAELRTAFLTRDAALIFHLKNHYAIIYALREWEETVLEEPSAPEGDDGTLPPSPELAEPAGPAAPAAPPVPAGATETESAAGGGGDAAARVSDTAGPSSGEAAPPAASTPPRPRRKVVRQLLTARKGQRPSVWIDFSEAIATMCRWDGHKIMLVKRKAAAEDALS
mmetsp:Transcript_36495/g.114398  ORF Transcript_36495/g.114398 Transcript_36495/m.114398 type:complete len:194 (-) Transcript_36495:187-768(-)